MKKPKIKLKKQDRKKYGKIVSSLNMIRFEGSTVVSSDMLREDVISVMVSALHQRDELAECIKAALTKYSMDIMEGKTGRCTCDACTARRKAEEKLSKQKTQN